MLPEELSNGLCSLNPHVERLCMVCDMQISGNGDIKKYRFYPAVMHSHARLTYTRWRRCWPTRKGEDGARNTGRAAACPELYTLFKVLLQGAREARRDRFRDHRNPDDLQRPGQDRTHRAGAAQRRAPLDRGMHAGGQRVRLGFPAEHEHPMLYRIHEGPTPEKLEALREFLKEFGLQLGGGDEPHAKDYAKLLTQDQGPAGRRSCCKP